ncbi:MAG TPA: acyl carrier protein [Terriglobia bacterium]|nr:acyl carrier protein [Terriglobia bacterium]
MNEMETRLAACFKSVLPDLPLAEIQKTDPDSLKDWDSVAIVTLFAVIEEEFDIEITIDDVNSDYSFQGILNCIKAKQQK